MVSQDRHQAAKVGQIDQLIEPELSRFCMPSSTMQAVHGFHLIGWFDNACHLCQPQARRLLLHAGKTKTGKQKYWFSKSSEGEILEEIPKGYEIHENPEAQVFLRKIVPQIITPFEVAVVENGLKKYAPEQNCLVDVERKHISSTTPSKSYST